MVEMSGTAPHQMPGYGEGWPTSTPPTQSPSPRANPGYSPGRVASIISGVLLLLVGLVALGGGGTLLWADLAARHNGYLTVAAADYRSSGYAMTSDRVTLWGNGHLWYQTSLIGDVRVTVTAADQATAVFVGIAPADAAQAYLAGTHYSTLTHLAGGRDSVVDHSGAAPAVPPVRSSIWTVSATGTGTQTLTWPSRDGTWMVVVMNADGSAPVSAHIDVGITAPSLVWISVTLFGVAALFIVAGVVLIMIPMGRVARERSVSSSTMIR
jgi:hypothetical protein